MADLSPTLKLELARVIAAEQARQDDIARAWRYYDGDAPQPIAIVTTKKGTKLNDNVRVNFSRLIVDTGVHYLFGQPLDIDLDESADTPEEQWLDDALPVRQRMILLQKMANNGGVTGHTFARILLPDGNPFPRVIALDPSMVRATWDPRDIDLVLRWSINFIGINPESNKPTQYETRITPEGDAKSPQAWTIRDFEGEPGTTLELVDELRWPYPFSPIVHCQNLPRANEFYGSPDLESDILDLQTAVDRILGFGNRIARTDSKPPRFLYGMTGTQAQALEVTSDGLIVMPGPKDQVSVDTPEWKSDLAGLLDFESRLVNHLREISRMPEVASGKADNVGALSSLALKILFAPIVSSTEAKRNTYGEMLTDLVKRLLVVGGKASDIDKAPEPILNWPEVVPDDPQAETQAMLADKEVGVSNATLMAKRGYDPEAEKRLKEQEQTDLGQQLLRDFDRGEEPPLE